MKKLLHERLRGHIDSTEAFRCDNGTSVLALWPKEADAIADEIEKYYIPRPRFEDGEPVQFGEEFADYSGNPHTLHEIRYRDKAAAGLGAKCLLEANTTSPKDYDGISFNLYDGTFVKRPEPKVLDADGVEIKVGDTVWTINVPKGHDKCTVKGFKTFDEIGTTDGDKPSTHAVMFESGGWMGNLCVTHREPDSLEKLREDMQKSYDISGVIVLGRYLDRLTAIMERDA